MSDILLKKVLELPEYKEYKEISKDDYRNPFEENAPFSISSKGWYDHRTNKQSSLNSLLQQINIDKIYSESKEDYKTIAKYFKTRKIFINSKTIKSLKSKINIYKGVTSILTPLFSIKGEMISLHSKAAKIICFQSLHLIIA